MNTLSQRCLLYIQVNTYLHLVGVQRRSVGRISSLAVTSIKTFIWELMRLPRKETGEKKGGSGPCSKDSHNLELRSISKLKVLTVCM